MKFLEFEKRLGKSFCSGIGIGAGMAIAGTAAAGGSIFSGIMGASAAKQQAGAITEAARIARQTTLELDDRARKDVAPFRDLGMQSGTMLAGLLTGDRKLDDLLKESSLFKFESEMGTRNLDRSLSARGLYGSGAGLETLARFNTQLVAEEGQRTWDRLFNLTTLGSNAAARMATNTTQTGNTLADLTMKSGVAAGGAIGEAGRSLATMGPGIAGPIASGINQYSQYQLLKPMLDRYSSNTEPLGQTNDDFSLTNG